MAMVYYANPNTALVRQAMSEGTLGCIVTPLQGNRVPDGAAWCADNGCYSNGYPGEAAWWAWLCRKSAGIARCAFAVAPDVLGDATSTLARSGPWLDRIRAELGLPAALVGQDGLEAMAVPWDTFDVLFIGGSTEWKLGAGARDLAAQARERGKGVHMGRVNSYTRLRYAAHIGATSVDGTLLAFGPDLWLPRLTRWLHNLDTQRDLFGEHV